MGARTPDAKKIAIKEAADAMKASGKKVNISQIAKKAKVSPPKCREILVEAGYAVGNKPRKTKAVPKVHRDTFDDPLTAITSLPIPRTYECLKELKLTLDAKLEKVNAALASKAKEIAVELKALGVK